MNEWTIYLGFSENDKSLTWINVYNFVSCSHCVFIYPSFYSFISFFLENDKSWHDVMNTVVFVCHLVALDLLLTGLFSSILFIPYTADPQTTHTTHINLSLAPLTDLYCCTIGNPHNTPDSSPAPTIPESPKRAADGHPSRTASDNCSLSLQINIHQEQQNTLMWSRVQTDTQQSPLHVQHTTVYSSISLFQHTSTCCCASEMSLISLTRPERLFLLF